MPGQGLSISLLTVSQVIYLLQFIQVIMRLVSLVLQNKKGENIIISASPSIHTRTCVLYSNFIYQHILETYRKRLKIQRTLTLQPNLLCVLSINKDFILYIFVNRNDLSLAFDGVKKVTEFINSNVKMFSGATGPARLQTISKKFVEFMSVMEEFLYTRQLNIKEYLHLSSHKNSKKKDVDHQIFNKFSHINNENDKRIIFDSHQTSSGIQGLDGKKKMKIYEQAKKLMIKSQDDSDLLEIDPQRQIFLTQYRKNMIYFASCGRRKQNQNQNSQYSIALSELSISQLQLPTEELLQQQQIIDQTIERQKIKAKINQKLELVLQNTKIKEVFQFGQILIEGTQKETGFIHLCSCQEHWNNSKLINKRITPSSTDTVIDMTTKLKFNTENNYKSKPIIDYIIRKQSFTPEKVPLLFVYTREVGPSSIEFIFKYKMNQKWKHRLYEVDISVYLNKEFLVMDCKSVPSAYSLKNNKITWKTKEMLPNSNNCKGKIILAFGSSNIPPKNIIKEIKLTMKASCGLIDNLKIQCQQDWGHISQAQKMLLIEYKISPNDE